MEPITDYSSIINTQLEEIQKDRGFTLLVNAVLLASTLTPVGEVAQGTAQAVRVSVPLVKEALKKWGPLAGAILVDVLRKLWSRSSPTTDALTDTLTKAKAKEKAKPEIRLRVNAVIAGLLQSEIKGLVPVTLPSVALPRVWHPEAVDSDDPRYSSAFERSPSDKLEFWEILERNADDYLMGYGHKSKFGPSVWRDPKYFNSNYPITISLQCRLIPIEITLINPPESGILEVSCTSYKAGVWASADKGVDRYLCGGYDYHGYSTGSKGPLQKYQNISLYGKLFEKIFHEVQTNDDSRKYRGVLYIEALELGNSRLKFRIDNDSIDVNFVFVSGERRPRFVNGGVIGETLHFKDRYIERITATLGYESILDGYCTGEHIQILPPQPVKEFTLFGEKTGNYLNCESRLLVCWYEDILGDTHPLIVRYYKWNPTDDHQGVRQQGVRLNTFFDPSDTSVHDLLDTDTKPRKYPDYRRSLK